MDRKRSERGAADAREEETETDASEEQQQQDGDAVYMAGEDDIALWIKEHPRDYDTREKLKDVMLRLLHDAFEQKEELPYVVRQTFDEAARHESPLLLLFLMFGLYFYERALTEPTLKQLCHPERLAHIMQNRYMNVYGREHMRATHNDEDDAHAGLGTLDRGVMNEGLAAYLNFFTGDASTATASLTDEEAARTPDRVSMELARFMTELMISYGMPGATRRAASKIAEATRAIEALTIGIYPPVGNFPAEAE